MKGALLSGGAQGAPLGRVHIPPRGWTPAQMCSKVDHLTVLPAGLPTSAPRKANLNPKDWDCRALLCLVPSHLLEEHEAGRGGQAAQPLEGAQGSQKASPL